VLGILLLSVACRGTSGPFEERFDSAGKWGTGTDIDVEGDVRDGRYEFLVKNDLGLFWTTAGESLRDGVYEVEATQLEGPLDNGYGMLFRVDTDENSFYMFEVSGDGYVWTGLCRERCEAEETPFIENGWFQSDAVNSGLDATNVLRVRAEGGNLIFFVNDQEVGRVTDNTLDAGDIGLVVETFGEGGVLVAFDNFTVMPLP
jgi:hypothetical protein